MGPLLASKEGQSKLVLKLLGQLHRDVRMLFAAADICVVVTGSGTHLCSGDRNWHTFVREGGRHLTEETRVGSRLSPVGVVEGKLGLEQVFLRVSLLRSFAVLIIPQMFYTHTLSFLPLRSKVRFSVTFPKSLELCRTVSPKLC